MRHLATARVPEPGFDPASLRARQREFQSRLSSAIERIGDPHVIKYVAPLLREGDVATLFRLLVDPDSRIRTAAHECAMLRYAYLVAAVSRDVGFDSFHRDDLVQRVFADLPRAVARANHSDRHIVDAEGWLRQRAYLIARQMHREEHGSPVRDASRSAPSVWQGMTVRTKGTRVPLETIDHDQNALGMPTAADGDVDRRDALLAAVHALAEEHPFFAEILRLHYFQGFRLDEIARCVGRSHGTTRNDVSKARVRLATIIRERFPDLAPPSSPDAGGTDAML